MTARMNHPGPRAAQRAQVCAAQLKPVCGTLPAGQTVMQAVAALFASHDCKGGTLCLDGVTCEPMRFVLPALSKDGQHAAWYSDTHAPEGAWTIRNSTASVGIRDGATFLHCHGIWSSDSQTWMGHLLPMEAIIAADVEVTGLGSAGTWFEALPDHETAFTLFTPQGGETGAGLFVRILPGEDVVTAIEQIAASHGICDARLHAVGSIDHVRFAEGHSMDCLATELRFDDARLVDGRARIRIDVVDIDGSIATGTLTRGDNPVGVTLELIIEPEETTP
ncbi:DUF296 domain-containing protein [Paracoccus sp. CPCC 101403]|uniref:DUF296 domain-containing protein n=1 Tax=Paracoccus broussonetiae TaxID=3075834 RepID=A0ABU3EBY9_9RHOB|nr:DUF296 domain-containing protein [Paracoccus sp. CPCC 101403]MDT1061010.1 DUF296 domain-containing protein [Paracoccus sp. CPCC 101403]